MATHHNLLSMYYAITDKIWQIIKYKDSLISYFGNEIIIHYTEEGITIQKCILYDTVEEAAAAFELLKTST